MFPEEQRVIAFTTRSGSDIFQRVEANGQESEAEAVPLEKEEPIL